MIDHLVIIFTVFFSVYSGFDEVTMLRKVFSGEPFRIGRSYMGMAAIILTRESLLYIMMQTINGFLTLGHFYLIISAKQVLIMKKRGARINGK